MSKAYESRLMEFTGDNNKRYWDCREVSDINHGAHQISQFLCTY